ncbi:MAG: TrkH family potassium uptake protein [Pseudomonadota bacterium]|nr:TrkH family potassium uptake protein [Pseudomonadota bacterium]
MPSLSFAFHVAGILVAGLGMLMMVPAIIDLALGNVDWQVFADCALVTWFIGLLLAQATRRPATELLSIRDGFIMTTLVWVILAGFSALPFLGLGLDYSDAYFEAISGLTTTGATVLTGLDHLPPGILFWRALLQWVGGVGIVVMAILILPFLRVGGMQLVHIESSERSGKVVPRAFQLISYIVGIYSGLTFACAVAYGLAGMTPFDAVSHAMTTLSTGGYANYDASFAYYKQASVHWLGIFFMIAGCLPFIAYIRAVQGDPGNIWRNPQVKALILLLAIAGVGLALWLSFAQGIAFADALRLSLFNVTSVVTTTGFASDDFGSWGPLAAVVFFVLMFAGGCTGSTSGSVKLYRHLVLAVVVRAHLQRLAHPRRVVPLTYAGRRLPADIAPSVLAFLAVYLGTIVVFATALAAMGLDFTTSISAATTAIGNVGPGLGTVIGPAGNFASVPDPAKWILSVAMLMGRLELFAVLVLLDPDFWRS